MDSCAILSRTNLGLRPYENLLSEMKIPYHLVGKSGYWSAPEIRSVLSYLGLVIGAQNHLLVGALASQFWPTKFLPRSKIMSKLKELKDQDTYWHLLVVGKSDPSYLGIDHKNIAALGDFIQFVHSLSRYRDLPPADALKSVLGALKVGDFYSEQEEIDNDPLQNLAELIKISGRHSSIKEFLDFCRRASAASKKKAGVALSTLHSAKGLEFHTVYLVQCSEGILPHAKSTDLASEQNCFFVGCSRAERELVISFSGQPSRFLKNVVQLQQETKNGETQV